VGFIGSKTLQNPNFGQKSQIWSNIVTLPKFQILAKNPKFGQKFNIY